MTPSNIFAAASRRSARRPARLLFALFALTGLVLSFPLPAAAQADAEEASPARELFIEELGCSGCHGRSGEGGLGPALDESGLTLSKFVKQVRLPSDVMPPFAPALASDAQLAVIYEWLEGTEAVKAPPPVVFDLDGFGQMAAGSEAEVAFTARRSDDEEAAAPSPDSPIRYRVTLLARDNTPVAGSTFAYRMPGEDDWREFETDDDGRGLLGPDDGIAAAEAVGEEGATTRLKIALPAGNYTFVVEALDWSDPAAPVALGVGTEVLRLE